MTYQELLSAESKNLDAIILYKEGIFLKAYEHSAFWTYNLIHPFKISKRTIKNVNSDVISLGFPETSLKKWFCKYEYEYLSPTCVKVRIGENIDEVRFEEWKDSFSITEAKSFSPQTAFLSKVPVFRVAYLFFFEMLELYNNMAKNYREPLGDILKNHSYFIVYNLRGMYDRGENQEMFQKAYEKTDEIKFALQALMDLHQIPESKFKIYSEQIVSISKQLSALCRKA